MFKRLVDWIITRAKRTPYFHLVHADGSMYMERYWLVKNFFGFSARVHGIHTPDMDRAMHDHPWSFISIVMRGAYIETTPNRQNTIDFHAVGAIGATEPQQERFRGTGSIAFHGFWHRHRVTLVTEWDYLPVWTLFITFPKRQSWGFFTPDGKIWWWVYESVHNKTNLDITLAHKDQSDA